MVGLEGACIIRHSDETHLDTGLVPSTMSRLSMTMDQHLVYLFSDRHGFMIVCEDLFARVLSCAEHLFRPEPELSGLESGILGRVMDVEDGLVHCPIEQSLFPFLLG